MTDPSEPNLREWIHWLVIDILGGTNPSQGPRTSHFVGTPKWGFLLWHRKWLVVSQTVGGKLNNVGISQYTCFFVWRNSPTKCTPFNNFSSDTDKLLGKKGERPVCDNDLIMWSLSIKQFKISDKSIMSLINASL